jgi:hypothetical protein
VVCGSYRRTITSALLVLLSGGAVGGESSALGKQALSFSCFTAMVAAAASVALFSCFVFVSF